MNLCSVTLASSGMAVLVSQPLLPLVLGFAIARIAPPELNEHFQARKPLTFFFISFYIFFCQSLLRHPQIT